MSAELGYFGDVDEVRERPSHRDSPQERISFQTFPIHQSIQIIIVLSIGARLADTGEFFYFALFSDMFSTLHILHIGWNSA